MTGLPLQPVENPILCSPFEEPDAHWRYDRATGIPSKVSGRRDAGYWFKTERTGSAQRRLALGGDTEEERDDLPLVNALRKDVARWRKSGWEGASDISKQLLRHWTRSDRLRRLFFCQIEAVETIIYLHELLGRGKEPRFKPEMRLAEYEQLESGINPRPDEWKAVVALPPRLVDLPNEEGGKPLPRRGCKMATGSGKTVVMSMLTAWSLCNRGRSGDARYPRHVLAVCPNLTIRDRLAVLDPGHRDNYYEKFDLVPPGLRPELAKGKVRVVNWHVFLPESPHAEGGKSYIVVDKGPESDESFARARLGDLYDGEPILVLNDEGHHAYRPALLPDNDKLTAEEKADREEATVWVAGLDRLHRGCGIGLCVDLSATPFYLKGSGFPEGAPFPWIVSDFALVDAIESGITKIPRLPSLDTTGRPDPQFFKLWESITAGLGPSEKVRGKPKPEVVYQKAEAALTTLASEWAEKFQLIADAAPGQERVPPVMIIVCDNTDIADWFHRRISGEEWVEVETEAEDDEDLEDESDDASSGRKSRKRKPRKVYGRGSVFPDLLSNESGREVTLRIDSELLAEAESGNPNATRKQAAEALRRVIATVGQPGQPGANVRCVVSVNMLSEGWDACNVTHILGLRAFGSQLLCEQVVGRGLRRMSYAVSRDPASGKELLDPEYVDIFGVPFSLIPFKGKKPGEKPPPDDRPRNEVVSLSERSNFEIRFPIVEGYTVQLRENLLRCDVSAMESTRINPAVTPTEAFVRPQVGYQIGAIGIAGGFAVEIVNRDAYYASTHPQSIAFEIARQVVARLGESSERPAGARRALFPQVLRYVEQYVERRVDFRGQNLCELGLATYAEKIVGLLLAAIEPDESQGEPPLLPILNRYHPIGSTANVQFKTLKPVIATVRSHLSGVAADTESWEQAATFQLEKSKHVDFYARNERLDFSIPYEFHGVSRVYVPDFLVRLVDGRTLIVELKGQPHHETDAKHEAAKRWARAVTRWGKLGRFEFMVCWDPQELAAKISTLASIPVVGRSVA